MKVGLIGSGVKAARRARALIACTGHNPMLLSEEAAEDPHRLDAFLARVNMAFIAVPTAVHFPVAVAATKQGVHVFMEWPPATSVRECEEVIRLAEEAGIEAAVSRPLRFHPVFDDLPSPPRPNLILLQQTLTEAALTRWLHRLAHAVDLCCTLAGSGSIQRIDAESVRMEAGRPEALAFTLRFHNGAYAQVSLRRHEGPSTGTLYVGGIGFQHETPFPDLEPEHDETEPIHVKSTRPFVSSATDADTLYVEETRAFVDAVAAHRPAPVSMLDGLHTMRIVERLMARLR